MSISGRGIANNVIISGHWKLKSFALWQWRQIWEKLTIWSNGISYEMYSPSLGFTQHGLHGLWHALNQSLTSFWLMNPRQDTLLPLWNTRRWSTINVTIHTLHGGALSVMRWCSGEKNLSEDPGARGCPVINHLMFADDTMFFSKPNATSVTTLKDILRQYRAVSGQWMSMSKFGDIFLHPHTTGSKATS